VTVSFGVSHLKQIRIALNLLCFQHFLYRFQVLLLKLSFLFVHVEVDFISFEILQTVIVIEALTSIYNEVNSIVLQLVQMLPCLLIEGRSDV